MLKHAPAPLLVLLAVGSLMLLGAAPPGGGLGDVTTPEVPGDATLDPPAPGLSGGDTGVTTSDRSLTGGQAPDTTAAQAGSQETLTGLFRIEPGECGDEGVTSGSYFRMVTPIGSPDAGPYVDNADSPCGDSTYTPLRPGSDGGLITGEYQAHPDPAFDSGGNARANGITAPQSFFGTEFSTATNPTDPQTGTRVPAPEVITDGSGNLDGDVRAFAAAWNGQHFNQGSPKPDGSRPGNTGGPTGSYDPATGRYTLQWTSHIQGGPFNGFTGVWHLEGSFASRESTGTAAGKDTDASAEAEQETTRGEVRSSDETPATDRETEARTGELPRTGGGAAVTLAPLLLGAAALLVPRRRPPR